jgi:hypothetical protein
MGVNLEIRNEVEQALDTVNPDYPVSVGELLTDMHGIDGTDSVVDVLERLRPDYVFEDRIQVIDLFEDPDYASLGVDPDYSGETLDLNELDDE